MKKVFNKDANPPKYEWHLTGKLVSINRKVKLVTDTANKNKFFSAVVETKDGQEVDVFVFKKTDKHASFQIGQDVNLTTPFDKKDPNHGVCWISLGGGRKLNVELIKDLEGNSESKKESVKSILKKNVIADAEVIWGIMPYNN